MSSVQNAPNKMCMVQECISVCVHARTCVFGGIEEMGVGNVSNVEMPVLRKKTLMGNIDKLLVKHLITESHQLVQHTWYLN